MGCSYLRSCGSLATVATIFLILLILHAPQALADTSPAARFFGHYEGKTIVRDDDDATTRDLAVSIEPDGEHFRVKWITATRQDDGEIKRKSYSISFEPSARPGIYKAAMRLDMFGHRQPLDPLQGEPYVWSRISGDTMTVYALLIDEKGGFDLQTYDRTLTRDGLKLHFTRLREGEPPRELTATLARVTDGKGTE